MSIIKKYKKYLPVDDKTPIISLEEGNTPLIKAKNIFLSKNIEIFFKYEGSNPTGSFKDRGMTVAISKAKQDCVEAVICASTGNTAASAAAYAAAASLPSFILIPEGKIALGKLAQALIYGAKVISLQALNFDRALSLVKELIKKYPLAVVNSINPYRIEGQKTAAYEICEQLGEAPNYLAIPVGNAGNITAYWRGFKEYFEEKKINKLPKLLGFQAAGAAPLVENKIIKNPETIATAIRIGNPAHREAALLAVKESCGSLNKVEDEEILAAHSLLAIKEGLFVEPASAASLAGILKLFKKNFFEKTKKKIKIVCVLTGHGLKDINIVLEKLKNNIITVKDKLNITDEIIEIIQKNMIK